MAVQPSERAVQMIIGFEVSSPEDYARNLTHPTWPGGMSGVTIGIGYDLGQGTPAEVRQALRAEWGDLLDAGTLARLAMVCGLHGRVAESRIDSLASVSVPFDAANTVFRRRDLPQYSARLEKVLERCDQLPPDSYGALLSLAYNRGPNGFLLGDDRHREMAQIRELMQVGAFVGIPDLIRAMKRIWQDAHGRPLPGMAGLVSRRDTEADLFQDGLDDACRVFNAQLAAPAGAPVAELQEAAHG